METISLSFPPQDKHLICGGGRLKVQTDSAMLCTSRLQWEDSAWSPAECGDTSISRLFTSPPHTHTCTQALRFAPLQIDTFLHYMHGCLPIWCNFIIHYSIGYYIYCIEFFSILLRLSFCYCQHLKLPTWWFNKMFGIILTYISLPLIFVLSNAEMERIYPFHLSMALLCNITLLCS